MATSELRVVLLKPSKYWTNGVTERYRRGFMPNSTLRHIQALTPRVLRGLNTRVTLIDEYVMGDPGYLDLLRSGACHLLGIVGVQSHQFHRSLDLAALALSRGVRHVVIGGPHPMTCDTTPLQGRGVSFSLAEAEVVWPEILNDAINGELRPVYGRERRWQPDLPAAVLTPPTRKEMARYALPMFGIYPARGCPFTCTFCSVIQIAGHAVRSQPVEATIESLRRAKAAGVRYIMFTSDNFNKYPQARELLEAVIDAGVGLPFFAQCDVQIGRDEPLLELMARAGCFQIYVGTESFSREVLKSVRKTHNQPEDYGHIARLCRKHGVCSHFSNIIGFPQEEERDCLEQLDRIVRLDPDMASFYILTPIPGTEQYQEFLEAGLIREPNLDRFDGINAVWDHPRMAARTLERLVFHSYDRFYSMGRMARKGVLRASGDNLLLKAMLFTKLSVLIRHHPMAGGVGRVSLDRARDYAELRRRTFGVDMAPLPDRLRPDGSEQASGTPEERDPAPGRVSVRHPGAI